MLKYKLKRIKKKKAIIWTTLILLFSVSMFSIVRYYAMSTALEGIAGSRIEGDTVYVNDIEADWNYYIGLNYTEVTSKTTLPGTNTNKYNSNTLAMVQINYDGRDINDDSLVGYVSHDASEHQSKFVYYKYYPIVDGKVRIELIDNPYTARPTERGFNGWVCDKNNDDGIDCKDLTFSYDDDYYLRYVEFEVPAADENGDRRAIINLRASWTQADVKTNDWEIADFNGKGMQKIPQSAVIGKVESTEDYLCPDSSTTYYSVVTINRNTNYPNGVYYFTDTTDRSNVINGNFDNSRNYPLTLTTSGNTRCNTNGGCAYLAEVNGNDLTLNDTYLVVTRNGRNYLGNVSNDYICSRPILVDGVIGYESMFTDGDLTRGFYYKDNSYTSARANLYYNASGIRCDVSGANCNTNNSYKLIQANETKTESYTLKTNEKYKDGENASNCTTTIGEWKECTVLEPKIDADGNYIYEVETDEDGNTIYETEIDTDGNVIYILDTDGNQIPVYKRDADGNRIFVYQEKNVTINNPENYYYLVTRDTNIFEVTYDIGIGDLLYGVPYTVTSAHNDKSRGNFSIDNTFNNYGVINVRSDMVIENVILNGPWHSTSNVTSTGNYINTGSYNFKIGRRVLASNSSRFQTYGVVGGTNNKVIVESGWYSYLKALPSSNTNNNYSISQYGSDYDRVTGNNSNLKINFQALSYDNGTHSSSTNSVVPSSEMIVKSGTFGNYMIDIDSIDEKGTTGTDSYYTYGIYAGGISSGSSTSYKTLKVEGGRVFSINGGPCVSSSYTGNVVGIYVTGGEIDNIVGGAGKSTTYGNRIISVTGGLINNAVAGGSNGSVDLDGGQISADTLVYIGGNAFIGGVPSVTDRNNLLYEVLPGSVFGAGLGQEGSKSSGTVYNSHVIINGGTIENNVYGGGNYGSTGTQTNSNTRAHVELLEGTINGSVFGGAKQTNGGYKNNSSGTVTRTLAKDYYQVSTIDSYEYVNYTSDISRTCSRNNYDVRINGGTCQYYSTGWFGGWTTYNNGMSSITSTNDVETGRSSDYRNYPSGYYKLDGSSTTGMICTADESVSQSTSTSNSSDNWNGDVSGTNSVTQNGTRTRTDTITYTCHYINLNNVVKAGSNAPASTDGYYERLDDGSFRKVTSFEYASSTVTNNYKHQVDILLDGAKVNGSIYGGSNINGTIYGNVDISLISGYVGNDDNGVYGGGKGVATQVSGNTVIKSNPSNDASLIINDIYGGSEDGKVNGSSTNNIGGSSNIVIDGGTISSVYGGGKGPNSTPYTYGPISVTVNSGNIGEVFGGNNVQGTVTNNNNPIVDINGGTINNVYGGSNGSGAGANVTNVYVKGGTINEGVYGGGKQAPTNGSTNVSITGGKFYELDENGLLLGEAAGVYGGGFAATATTTNVNILTGANVYNVYGGSNESGRVTTTNVNNEAGNIACNTYGGGRFAEVGTSNNNLNGSNLTYRLRDYEALYNNACGNAFGGGEQADVENANVTLNGSTLFNVYGGSNQSGTVNSSTVLLKNGAIYTAFGGNNAGGTTESSNVTINESGGTLRVDNVFGGSNGSGAVSNDTYTQIINGIVKEDIFGGGNEAKTLNSTIVNVYGGEVRSVYGGGNRSFVGNATADASGAFATGTQEGKTTVNVVNGLVNKNVYGSGNSSFVYGSTEVNFGQKAINSINNIRNIDNLPNINSVGRVIKVTGNVFGGSETNADESATYDYSYNGVVGDATVSIDGLNYVNAGNVTLNIGGQIYGSGNNAATSGIKKLYIDNWGLENNPVNTGALKRFTTVYVTDSNVELNGDRDRTSAKPYKYSLVRVDALYVLGSKQTSDELNGSTLYLRCGSTFLGGFYSGIIDGGNFVPQETAENDGILTNKVSDNKIYMYENKVLSVSNSETPDASLAGSVKGMAFLGMYVHEIGQGFEKGIYDSSLKENDIVDNKVYDAISDTSYTYVYGKHDYEPDVQRTTNGFYTNYVDEDTKAVNVDFVDVTPTSEDYYKWIIGEEPTDIIVDLFANRYSVEGTENKAIDIKELQEMIGGNTQSWRDATMRIYDINTSDFSAKASDVKEAYNTVLVDKSEIKSYNLDDEDGNGVIDANQKFALSMGTTTSGWLNNYRTNFYDKDNGSEYGDDFCDVGANGDCIGDSVYMYDSTSSNRYLTFWLHYSKNLDFSVAKDPDQEQVNISLGTVYIYTEFTNPHGDPTDASNVKKVRIVVNISMFDGEFDTYGRSIAPGKKYEVFRTRATSIPTNGSFSIYQSLSLDLNGIVLADKNKEERWNVNKIYNKAYVGKDENGNDVEISESYRYLNSSYLFPVGTKITMLDLADSEQYYYEVTEENYQQMKTQMGNNNVVKYRLEDFIRMGSTDPNNKYDDDMNGEDSTKYRHKQVLDSGETADLAIEEFIFTVDFAGVDPSNATNVEMTNTFYMTLAREENGIEKIIISAGQDPDTEMVYTLNPNVNSNITISEDGFVNEDGSLANRDETFTMYVGADADLQLRTNLEQKDNAGNLLSGVTNTIYDDYKLGALITVMRQKKDESGNPEKDASGNIIYEQVSTEMFGTVISINGNNYYPQINGSTRVELAGRISDVISTINIDFSNSSMINQEYKLVVETFASYDGLYYGTYKPTTREYKFELLNNDYGIDVSVPPEQVTHDVNTGADKNGSRDIIYSVDTRNGLANPNLKISVQRRNYNDAYDTGYTVIDVKDIAEAIYVGDSTINQLDSCYASDSTGKCSYYNLGNIDKNLDKTTYDITMKLKEGPSDTDKADKNNAKWKSGTYKIVFTMYDGDTPVGEVYEYLIIRSLDVDGEFEGSGM